MCKDRNTSGFTWPEPKIEKPEPEYDLNLKFKIQVRLSWRNPKIFVECKNFNFRSDPKMEFRLGSYSGQTWNYSGSGHIHVEHLLGQVRPEFWKQGSGQPKPVLRPHGTPSITVHCKYVLFKVFVSIHFIRTHI